MSVENINDYLKTLTDFESVLRTVDVNAFGLERIKKFLGMVKDPQKCLYIIHVAGSKGKGSTCAMLSSILVNAGYKVGLYTSPHLHHWSERIQVLTKESQTENKNGDFFGSITIDSAQEIYMQWMQDLDHEVVKSLTFFEFMTALALEHFRREKVDCVIWETGLGGRLDATNAISTNIVAITTIALEHMRLLGHSRDVIAKEKAGVIKERSQRVVLSRQSKDVEDVLGLRCLEYGIKPLIVGHDVKILFKKVDVQGQLIEIVSKSFHLSDVSVRLIGHHQLDNVGVVMGIVEHLCAKEWNIEECHVRDGLAQVYWPCRFEIFLKEKTFIVDGAHTVEAMQFVLESLNELWPKQKFLLVFGVSDDKNKEALAQCWGSYICGAIITRSTHPRAAIFTFEEIEKLFLNTKVCMMRGVKEAMELALSWEHAPIVVVCGSLFVAAEAQRWLKEKV